MIGSVEFFGDPGDLGKGLQVKRCFRPRADQKEKGRGFLCQRRKNKVSVIDPQQNYGLIDIVSVRVQQQDLGRQLQRVQR